MGGEKEKEGYFRLCRIYKSIKDRDTAPASVCLDLERKVCEIATSVYGSEHRFHTTLHNAAPNMFTFLQFPGMPPHNNPAELEVRDTIVYHRGIRHKLNNAEGMRVFSILISFARTCHKQGIFPWMAIMEACHNHSWNIFEDGVPDPEKYWCKPRPAAEPHPDTGPPLQHPAIPA